MAVASTERIGEFLASVAERVREHGWIVQGVVGEEPSETFGYTVGLHAKGLPELWIGTLNPTTQGADVLNDIAAAAVGGLPLEVGLVGRTAADWQMPLRLVGPVDLDDAGVNVAKVFAREDSNDEPLQVLQVLWPDADGRFPDEDGYDHDAFPQRVLAPEPHVYAVGLPVIITVHADGRVEYFVDTSEAGQGIREYESWGDHDPPEAQLRADAELVEADHARRSS